MQEQLGTCENCGRDESEVASVKRMYVVPETWDQKGSSKTMDEVEQWCYSCRTQYPHEDVE